MVTEEGGAPGTVVIRDGRVDAVLPPGAALPPAHETLDATGLHVLPGIVDSHVHLNEPGRTRWEGYRTGTAAAAAGGVTTVLDMPLNADPPTLSAPDLALKRRAAARSAVVDYAHWGGLVDDNLDELDALFEAGVVAVKAFLCESGLEGYSRVPPPLLRRAMQRIAARAGILGLHAEDYAATSHGAQVARAEGRRSPRDWARSRPPETELRSVKEALALAGETGCRVHFVHLSTAGALAEVGRARAAGVDATGETCPHYLALDQDDLERLGPVAKCAPPLRARAEVEALWQALDDGAVSLIGSDHSPCPPGMKHAGAHDIWRAWGGISGVQLTLPLLLTEGFHGRGVPLASIVRLIAGAPARRFGLWPRKGSLAPGSDADLALVDLDATWVVRRESLLQRWPQTNPYLGRHLRGRVRTTLVRGQVVYADGLLRVKPGYGRLARPDLTYLLGDTV